jgi:mono/diheme cytochrome c family protein
MIIWVYFIAAYLSLVVINGIVTFMLTPGEWLATGEFWDGFFNPTYWPSLVLRTGICIIMAAAFLLFAARRTGEDARPRLVRFVGIWLVVGVVLGYLGFRWWESALPDSVRALFLGDSPGLLALADTRGFLMWAAAATLGLGVVFLLAFPRSAGLVPAVMILLAACGFFGGYERLREGCRKPYLIHDHMFSNGVLVQEIPRLNEEGILSKARWASRVPTDDPVARGRQVFRAQCSSCHTLDGYLAIPPLLPDDPDMIFSVVYALYDQGESYTSLAPGETVDKTELTYPYMPPFVGTDEEMEALAEYLGTLATAASEAGGGS